MIEQDATLHLPVGCALIEVDAVLDLDLATDLHPLVAVWFDGVKITEAVATFTACLGAKLMWHAAIAWVDGDTGRAVIDELRGDVLGDAKARAGDRCFDLTRTLETVP